MDELWYMLREQGMKVKDTKVVSAKDSLMLKSNNRSVHIRQVEYNNFSITFLT